MACRLCAALVLTLVVPGVRQSPAKAERYGLGGPAEAGHYVLWAAPRAPAARTQTPAPDGPAFEVVSVRPSDPRMPRSNIEVLPGGRFNAINMTLRELVSLAYPIDGRFRDEFTLAGGAGWVSSSRFDIIAKVEGHSFGDTNRPGILATEAERAALERVREMLRRVLAERFKLRMHNETRQLPIYSLVRARADRSLGPDIRPSETDCLTLLKSGPIPDAREFKCGNLLGPRGKVSGRAVPMRTLALNMNDWVQRPVVDNTGLTGAWDLTLTWAPEGSPQAADGSAPSIFTAVQEQLGLKLESTRGPVDVLIIDGAERPIPD
jgi:uncharacterized protein (TIGR03435 family)